MKELDRLIGNKRDLIARLDKWTSEELSNRVNKESWNAKQVIEHMLVSEAGTFHYIKKKTSSGWDALEEVKSEHRESSEKLQSALTSPKKWKAPPVLPDPKGEESWEQLKQKWQEMNRAFESLVKSMPEGGESKLVSKHPYAGRQTMEQTIAFLAEHIVHHQYQIDELEKNLQNE